VTKKKLLGHGIKVKVGTTFVAFVKTVKFADISREMVNVTDLESTAEEFLDADPPLIGQITFTAFWDPDDTDDIAIDNILLNDDISEREVDVEFQYRTTATGTPPAASTWAYKHKRYACRLVSASPAEVGSKGEMMRTITAQPIALPESGNVT
jgi:hypothetical protein